MDRLGNGRNVNMQTYNIITHSGSFHADDVLAVAITFLHLGGTPYKLIRTRDALDPSIKDNPCIFLDVGGEYNTKDIFNMSFDHHQKGGAGYRENQLPYATAGLVWKQFGRSIISDQLVQKLRIPLTEEEIQKVWTMVEEMLIVGVDAQDCGVKSSVNPMYNQFSFSTSVVIDNPLTSLVEFVYENIFTGQLFFSEDEHFMKSVSRAQERLVRLIHWCADKVLAVRLIDNNSFLLEDGKIIVLTKRLPVKEVLSERNHIYAVIPDTNGSWLVVALSQGKEREFSPKLPFPKSWAGLRDYQLSLITGVSDATFCHNGRFAAGAKSQDGAILLAKLALNYP
jgi:uncharacterized UPF0160 family protein